MRRVYETHNARVSVSASFSDLRLTRCNLKTDRFRPYYASFVLGGGGAIFVNVVVRVISSFVCVYEIFSQPPLTRSHESWRSFCSWTFDFNSSCHSQIPVKEMRPKYYLPYYSPDVGFDRLLTLWPCKLMNSAKKKLTNCWFRNFDTSFILVTNEASFPF